MSTCELELSSEVHLWADWIDDRADSGVLLDVLDEDERARAARFHFERDRRRFVRRRTFARRVLAGYVGVEPGSLHFRTSVRGKPELEPARGITFSTSHSDGLAVVAVASERPVGVDIERSRPIPEALDIARRFFSRREHEHLRSIEAASRSQAFLVLWTRKEAYAKAVGGGLSIPLDEADVLGDGERLAAPGGPSGESPFVVASLDVQEGYVGAVSVAGAGIVTRHMTSLAAAS